MKIELNFSKRYEVTIPQDASFGGIYVVYAFNGLSDSPLWKLLDIGEADNIYNRYLRHERKRLWERFATDNNMKLVYYLAEINNEHNYRKIAEAAMLFRFQPMFDKSGLQGYHHGEVEIVVKGGLENAFGSFIQRDTDI